MKHNVFTLLIVLAVGLCWSGQASDAFTPQLAPRFSLAGQPQSSLSSVICTASNQNPEADDRNATITEEKWDGWIEELKKYEKHFGTVNVPGTHYHNKDEWAGLAKWVFNIRQYQGRLPKERYDQLTTMGFTFKGSREEKLDQQWAEMFDRLVQYNITERHNRVPSKYTQDLPLGKWVSRQRNLRKEGKLKPEREEQLNSIKFEWQIHLNPVGGDRANSKYDNIWYEKLANLTQFYEENGHYWPAERSSNATIKRLGQWTQNQRHLKRKDDLRKDRLQALERIGFPWDDTDNKEAKWFTKFQKLKDVLEQRNQDGAEGSSFTYTVLGRSLYDWIRRQRLANERDDLDPKRKEILDGIGFEWIQASDQERE